jgi:hypothetical protein
MHNDDDDDSDNEINEDNDVNDYDGDIDMMHNSIIFNSTKCTIVINMTMIFTFLQ